MIAPTHPISPLRQRMIDDVRMRQLAPKTQHHYLRAVRQFADFLGRSPDTATAEDLRRYQLHLVDGGTSPVSLTAAITALKFFFTITADQPKLMARMSPVRVPRYVSTRKHIAWQIRMIQSLLCTFPSKYLLTSRAK